jgi:Ca-activated chloride channel homolog
MSGFTRYLSFALAAMLLVACDWTPGQPATGTPESSPVPADTVVIVHWGASHISDLLPDFAAEFNAAGHTTASGKHIEVRPIAVDSGEQVNRLVEAVQQGQVMDLKFGEPTVVNTTADFWLAELNQRAGRQVVDLSRTQELGIAWTGIATYREMAECLGWPTKDIGYGDIVALRNNPKGWQGVCGSAAQASWGTKPLMSWTDPLISSTARSVLIGLYSVAAGKPTDQLSVADVQDPKVVQYVKDFQKGVDHYVPKSLLLLTKMTTASSHIFWLAEDVVIEFNDAIRQGKVPPGVDPYTSPIHPLAQKGMVFIYPKEGSIAHNQPAGIIDAPWVSADEQDAARQWIAYLRDPAQQERLMKDGFRPGITMTLACPICSAYGLDPNKPTKVLKPVKPEVTAAIIGAWGNIKKPGVVTFAVDTSASMSGPKLVEAKRGLTLALDNMSTTTSVGLIAFSDTMSHPIAVDSIQSNKFNIADEVDKLIATGGTALYDGLFEAIQMVDSAPGDADTIRGVVLLTDGRATAGTKRLHDIVHMISRADEKPIESFDGMDGVEFGVTRDGVQVKKADISGSSLKLQTKHPIKIFFVGIGEDADYEICRILTETTHAICQKTTEESLAAILADFGKYF